MRLLTGRQLLLGGVFGLSLGLSALAMIAAVPLPKSSGKAPARSLAQKDVQTQRRALGKIALAGGDHRH